MWLSTVGVGDSLGITFRCGLLEQSLNQQVVRNDMAKSKEEVRAERNRLFKKDDAQAGEAVALGRSFLNAPSLLDARNGQIGALRGEASVTIHTRQAQQLLTGREAVDGRPPVMGLMRFSSILTQITTAAKQDDPWADWHLVQLEEKLTAAGEHLTQQLSNIERVLKANKLMDVQVSESVKPMKVSIGFASSYAYWVARLILQYDEVVRAVLTAKHVAMISHEAANQLLSDAGASLRRVFESTARYRFTGLTRADVLANNARIAEAEKRLDRKLEQVPVDILDKSRRASYAPTIVSAGQVTPLTPTAAVAEDVATVATEDVV